LSTRDTSALVLAVMTLVAMAGCTSTADGIAIPANGQIERPASSTTPGSGPNNYGAPDVPNPLDATPFMTRPCAALTTEQLQSFNLPLNGEPDLDSSVAKAVGPRCGWLNSQVGEDVGIAFVTGNKNGLADLYREHQLGSFRGYWVETTVEGYPGIFADENDYRSHGTCGLTLGISNTLAIDITEIGPLRDEQKSCDRAKQVAAAVVGTLKAGG
jgi:hypothetical protein